MIDEEFQYTQINRIVQLFEWGRYKETIQEVEAYIKEYPENPEGYALLGKTYLGKSEPDKALHWAKEALQRDPEHPWAWEARVGALYTKEKWKATMKALEEALIIFPDEDYYHLLKANIHNINGNYKQANESIERALELDPDHALYHANYSLIQQVLGNEKNSLEAEALALELHPENPQIFMYLAWAAEQRNDYKKSLEYLANSIRLDPTDKQIRKEYLGNLQKQYKIYRIFLFPSRLLSKLHPIFMLLIWFVLWTLFRPLMLLGILLYIIVHWSTRLIVNVKVFGNLLGK